MGVEGLVMAAHDTKSLMDKLRELPAEKLAEIEAFIDWLRARQRALNKAAEARDSRSSATETPPVEVPGTPASAIVLKDRR
jgi:hypothetical protein